MTLILYWHKCMRSFTSRALNTDQNKYDPDLWFWVRMNINITYLSALGLAGAANNASSASSSNRLLLDGLGLALLVTLLTPEDLDRELIEVTDWVDLTLLALGFSSSDQLSSFQERSKWNFKIQKTLRYSLVYNLVHNIPTVSNFWDEILISCLSRLRIHFPKSKSVSF